jgi:Flp pilus assembly protein TadG
MRLPAAMAALVRDQRGVAAIEFAFIVPILLCMYFMTMEISQAIETNKKLGRAGNLVGDLITQQAEISSSEVDGILRIGEALLQPYNRTYPTITVTALDIGTNSDTKAAEAKVLWSRKMEWSPDTKTVTFTKGGTTNVTVPQTLLVAGTFLIRVDAALNYKPVLLYAAQGTAMGVPSAFDSIAMGETYFMRPRRSLTVECKDCPK